MSAASIGARVKARLAARELTLEGAVALSKKLKAPVSFGSWQKLRAGGEVTDLPTLRNVARTLDMTLAELLGEASALQLAPAAIIASPLDPRLDFDPEKLAELVETVKAHGVLQPIIVRPAKPLPEAPAVKYEIVMGERRWRAAVAAKVATIPAVVRDVSDAELVELALIENLQRADMKPLEIADALLRSSESKPTKAVAASIGWGLRVVQEYISVARHLCREGRDYLANGDLNISQATALVVERDPKQQAVDVQWAFTLDASEDEIRRRIAARKEAASAPLFGDTVPAAKPPKAKAWPKPLEGVYDDGPGSGALTIGFARDRMSVTLTALETEQDIWRAAIGNYQLTTGGGGDPLRIHDRSHASAPAAFRHVALQFVRRVVGHLGASTPTHREREVRFTAAAIRHIAEQLVTHGANADFAKAWADDANTILNDAVAAQAPRRNDAPEQAEGEHAENMQRARDLAARAHDDALPWHDGLTFVYTEKPIRHRPVVRPSLQAMLHFLCDRRGFVNSQLQGVDDLDGWQVDDDGALYICLPGGNEPMLYIADDGR